MERLNLRSKIIQKRQSQGETMEGHALALLDKSQVKKSYKQKSKNLAASKQHEKKGR